MAKYIVLDKKQFGNTGLVPLRRGDDWGLVGKVVDKYATISEDVDMTGASATGFFKAADSEDADKVIDFPMNFVKADCGGFEIDVPATGSELIALASSTSFYGVVDHPTLGLFTVETEREVLEIRDRGFDGDCC